MQTSPAFEEALARPELAPADGSPLADRLLAYSRLLSLAAQELVALEGGDPARRRELSEARDELTREIQAPPTDRDDEDPEAADAGKDDELPMPLPIQLSSLLAEALEALELHEEEERRMQDRWSSLEEDALKAIHVTGGIVSYRAGRYPERQALDARLDLRF